MLRLRASTCSLGALAACLLACGDEPTDDPSDPSDPAVTQHLRDCALRCEDEVRCLSEPPDLDDCLDQCDAMAVEACIDLHAEYFECTNLVSCGERYDARLTEQCGDELQALFIGCEAWRDAPE